jgi:hypothetical protein
VHGSLTETYRGIDVGLFALPMMGARASFDRAMDLKLGKDLGTFDAKLKALRASNLIDERAGKILRQMIDAGSASTHRGWQPDLQTVTSVMTEVQHTVYDWFVRDGAASAVTAVTPPRPRN